MVVVAKQQQLAHNGLFYLSYSMLLPNITHLFLSSSNNYHYYSLQQWAKGKEMGVCILFVIAVTRYFITSSCHKCCCLSTLLVVASRLVNLITDSLTNSLIAVMLIRYGKNQEQRWSVWSREATNRNMCLKHGAVVTWLVASVIILSRLVVYFVLLLLLLYSLIY